MNLLELLNMTNQRFGFVWDEIRRFHQDKNYKQNRSAWPKEIFMPYDFWTNCIFGDDDTDDPFDPRIKDIVILHCLGTWRYTQGIYRFDEDLLHMLWDSKLKGNLPAFLLKRLPQYCVFIETPRKVFMGKPLEGFFAFLAYHMKDKETELRLVLKFEAGSNASYTLLLKEKPIHEIIDELRQRIFDYEPKLLETAGLQTDEESKEYSEGLQSLLSLVFYLCSETPDYTASKTPVRCKRSKVKGGYKLFCPPGPTIYKVGYMIGRRYRKALQEYKEGVGKGLKPHMRKAHWHGFWKGPRKNRQRYICHFLAPIEVNYQTNLAIKEDCTQ